MEKLREKLYRHYQEPGQSDDQLLEEAIVTLEHYLELKNEFELLHRSRPLAIAYLALCHEKDVREGKVCKKLLEDREELKSKNHIADDACGSWIMKRFTKME